MENEKEYLAAEAELLARHGVEGSSRFIELPWRGLRTHLIEAGTGDPIVFVIGGGGFSGLWAPLLGRMAGHKLYAVDRPGFGLTDPIAHTTRSLRDDAISFLEALLDALQIDRATIIANSMGSLWTFWLALDRPARIERMIHVGCPAHLFDTGLPLPLRLLGRPGIGRLMMAMMPPSPKQARMIYGSMNEGDAVATDAALERAIVATSRLPTYGPALRGLMKAVTTTFKARPQIALTEEQLARVEQPLQVIWGLSDPIGPVEAGQRIVELVAEGAFAAVDGGHLPWLDSPDRVAEIAREFLRSGSMSAAVD